MTVGACVSRSACTRKAPVWLADADAILAANSRRDEPEAVDGVVGSFFRWDGNCTAVNDWKKVVWT